MTRDEMRKHIEEILADPENMGASTKKQTIAWCNALQEALALLRVPDNAEIEVTRAWLCSHDWIAFSGNGKPITVLLEKALDALAREPGLEARIRKLDNANIAERQYNGEANERLRDRDRHIASLEARVKELEAGIEYELKARRQLDCEKERMLDNDAKRIAALEAKLASMERNERAVGEIADRRITVLEAKIARVREARSHFEQTMPVKMIDAALADEEG